MPGSHDKLTAGVPPLPDVPPPPLLPDEPALPPAPLPMLDLPPLPPDVDVPPEPPEAVDPLPPDDSSDSGDLGSVDVHPQRTTNALASILWEVRMEHHPFLES
jgi:hypothetical protein